ncbi:MAG: glycosyltransferase family 2 protein [Atopobium sp.]|jgi:glycosyltransferase involved in cell wall biosynthesis|nr:glycosyltransferase family 2 protein [Atopobium sp.]
MTLKQAIKTIYRHTAPWHASRSRMTPEEAQHILTAYTPNPSTTCVANNILNPQYDLQIIVPAYNAEKFVAQCLESALQQKTKYSYLITVVNDGSTDRTPEIIESYHVKFPDRIEVINQENRGFSGARNAALRILKGRFITLLDSDDVLGKGAVQTLLTEAYMTDADIVQGGWITNTEFRMPVLTGGEGTEYHPEAPSGYPWGKLYKAKVFVHFQFPEGYWFEDTPISFILYGAGYSSKVIPDVVYGYRLNPDGITAKSSRSKRSVESYYITELCLREFPQFEVKYDQRAYEYFLRQCMMNYSRTRKQSKNVREAIFVLEGELMEKYLNDKYSKVNKAIEVVLRKKQFHKFEVLSRTR